MNQGEHINKVLEIHKNPTLDEVWDLCIRNFLYNQEKYVREVLNLFEKIGITKESKIADISAGGGFPAMNLVKLGYKIDCFDGFSCGLFNSNTEKYDVKIKCEDRLWDDIPNSISNKTYDFVFCRGNSFIFAGGGWGAKKEFNRNEVMAKYEKTMGIFANIIKDGGYLYIDKFKDSELGHKEKSGTIVVDGREEDVLFSSQRFPKEKIRRVFLERAVFDKIISSEQRITYDLSENELIFLLKRAGFIEINKIKIIEEKHFDVWLVRK